MKEEKITKFIISILKFLLFFIIPYGLQIILLLVVTYILKKDMASINNTIRSIMLLSIEIILLITYVLLNKSKFKGSFKDFYKNRHDYIDTIIKYWIPGLLLMIITNAIITGLIKGNIASNEELNRLLLKKMPLYSIPSACLLAPVIEELAFRATFKDNFKKDILFILFTGLLFGSCHVISTYSTLSDLLFIIPYSMLGLSLAAIYCKTNNILASISIHILHNTVTLLLILCI